MLRSVQAGLACRKVGVIVLGSVLVLTGAVWSLESAVGQSGYRGSGTRGGTVQDTRPFEAKFWDWLQFVRYRNWAPAPGQNGEFYQGQSPHGAFLKMYLNRTAVANPQTLPHGSVIIKENYGADQATLMAVTVMYRSKGFDAEHGDWYWVKYNPDGTVAMKGNMKLAGRVGGCIECHSGAAGGDFAFFNDK